MNAMNHNNVTMNSVSLKSYIIEEPILNHDYEVLWERIRNIEFTPKDLKEFDMKKASTLQEQYTHLLK